ncbi:MAG: MBL fold metallo-hydrolase [Pseudomonadota bacterium]
MLQQSINRRTALAYLAAGATTTPLAMPAFAATKFTVGNASVTASSDGHFLMPSDFFLMPSDFFLGTPLRDQLGDPVQIAANTYAYRRGGKTFLFDVGAGAGDFITQSFPTVSKLPEDLKMAGIDPEEVTAIVITHMHPDHIRSVAIGAKPAFPNATVHIAEADWNFWNAEGFAGSGPEGMRPMIASVQETSQAIKGNIALHNGSADLGQGVTVLPAVGHTPGHTAILLDGGSQQLMITGDLTVHEDVHFQNSDYGWALDVDGEQAVETRKRLLDTIATDRLIMAAAHVTRPGLGTVERLGIGFKISRL